MRFLFWKFLRYRPLVTVFLLFLPCCRGAGGGEGEAAGGVLSGTGSRAPDLLARALEKARKEDKLVLVEVFDPSCKYCRAMEEVFLHPRVRKVLEEFVWIKLGLKGNPLVQRFKLEMTPAFLVFRPDGKPMEDVLEGFRSGPVLATELEDFLRLFHGEEDVDIPLDTHPMAGRGCKIEKGR